MNSRHASVLQYTFILLSTQSEFDVFHQYRQNLKLSSNVRCQVQSRFILLWLWEVKWIDGQTWSRVNVQSKKHLQRKSDISYDVTSSVAKMLEEVIFPLYLAVGRLHLEVCLWFWLHSARKTYCSESCEQTSTSEDGAQMYKEKLGEMSLSHWKKLKGNPASWAV